MYHLAAQQFASASDLCTVTVALEGYYASTCGAVWSNKQGSLKRLSPAKNALSNIRWATRKQNASARRGSSFCLTNGRKAWAFYV
jgi:hypothetical protein